MSDDDQESKAKNVSTEEKAKACRELSAKNLTKQGKIDLKKEISARLNVDYRTVGKWLKQFKKKGKTTGAVGRPMKTSDAPTLQAAIANLNQTQQSVRARSSTENFLVTNAKDTARAQGKPSHGVSLSQSTIYRRAKDLEKLDVVRRKAQVKPDVRIESEDSTRNMLSFFNTVVSTSRDLHPAMNFNTDKTTMIYGVSQTRCMFHPHQVLRPCL
jgi:hypothetical protein